MRQSIFRLALLALGIMLTAPVRADEGMWEYTHLPTATLQQKYGFEATPAWIDHLMKSSVRFNSGGSGSFVSSTGLVLTNHHVGANTLAKLSSAAHDTYNLGFYARTLAEEVKAPDLELNQLVSIEDVTARVNAAVPTSLPPSAANLARRAVISTIEKESFDSTGLRSDVVTLYQGGEYHLYRYKKYTDVRLVFAPEFPIAFYGGDSANFEYPRYDLDMCLFRVYENGVPAHVDNYLTWAPQGLKDQDLVFVSGHPGRTSRLYTVAALQFLREVSVPYTLESLQRRERLLQRFSARSPEAARRAQKDLFSTQNSRKVYVGLLHGLQGGSIMASKMAEETKLRQRVSQDLALQPLAGVWDAIARAQAEDRQLYVRRSLLESGQGFNSRLFTIARNLVRMADEDAKPNDKRLPEYRTSGRASLELALFSEAPIYDDLEKAKLADSLAVLVGKLGANDEVVKSVLQGQSPAERAAALVDGTRLQDAAVRHALAQGGQTAVAQSADTMIQLARAVDGAARAIRQQGEEKVDEPERQGYAQIANALFALEGTNRYPDATFTLRLAFGEVKGYLQDGKFIEPMTQLAEAFAEEARHGAHAPWALPATWHRAKDRGELDLKTPFDFVSTADIIGGNSGSPVVNRHGDLVGLIFDGNRQSLLANYQYSDEQSRAIAVHAGAMLESLRHIYGAGALADELQGQ